MPSYHFISLHVFKRVHFCNLWGKRATSIILFCFCFSFKTLSDGLPNEEMNTIWMLQMSFTGFQSMSTQRKVLSDKKAQEGEAFSVEFWVSYPGTSLRVFTSLSTHCSLQYICPCKPWHSFSPQLLWVVRFLDLPWQGSTYCEYTVG